MKHLAAIALIAAASAHADGKGEGEIDVGGVKRTYEMFAPAAVPGSSHGSSPSSGVRPLLIVLHGRGGSAHQVRVDTGFDEEATKRNFVVAYPDAIDHAWHHQVLLTARDVKLDEAKQALDDDEKFIFALVDSLVAKGMVDAKHVYIAGHSNGAMMTLTLACDHAERIAGIAVVAGNLGAAPATCALSRAMPAIFFQGTEDPLVKFAGGSLGLNAARGVMLSADDTVRVFADKAGCAPGVKRAPVDAVKDDGTDLVIEDRAKCTTPIARVIVEHGGHGWPGRPPWFLRHTKEIDATSAIAAFFFAGTSP
jgi:polyhydroxybutyrate depolymerase